MSLFRGAKHEMVWGGRNPPDFWEDFFLIAHMVLCPGYFYGGGGGVGSP